MAPSNTSDDTADVDSAETSTQPRSAGGESQTGGRAPSLLNKALHNALASNATAKQTPARDPGSSASQGASGTASTPSRASPAIVDPSVRAQFEQQQDFISFEKSPSPPPSRGDHGHGRTPGSRRRDRGGVDAGPSGTKRRRTDEPDEGTRRMQKRERDRSTPWCETPGVDWDACRNATEM